MEVESVRVMVFNATFNNISVILWQSVLLVEETGVPGESHQPATSYFVISIWVLPPPFMGCRGHDGMVVGFTTTCAISAYRH
jgi:hypothetical protein